MIFAPEETKFCQTWLYLFARLFFLSCKGWAAFGTDVVDPDAHGAISLPLMQQQLAPLTDWMRFDLLCTPGAHFLQAYLF